MDVAMKVKRTQQRTRTSGVVGPQQNGGGASSTSHFSRQRTRKKFHKWYFFDNPLIADNHIPYGPIEFPVVWNELRTNRQLCDGIVRCEDGEEFKIHRAILSAVSPYFKALFTNSINRGQPEETEAEIHVPSKIFSLILDFAYGGYCNILAENVQSLLAYADQLEVLGVVDLCSRFILTHLTPNTCLSYMRFARNYMCGTLHHGVSRYVRIHFAEIVQTDDFLQLNGDELHAILSDDALNARSERDVFEAIVRWVEHKTEDRKSNLFTLLSCVRFGLFPIGYLHDVVMKWPLMQSDKEAMDLVKEAAALLDKFRQEGIDYRYPLARPRIPHEILFAIGGWSAGSPTSFVETYDNRADRWLLSSDTDQSPRAYHGTCTLNGLIYVIGGFDGYEHFNTVRSYCPVTHEWREHACMYYPRCYVSVAMHDGRIYAMGGYNGRTRMSSVERYDPDLNQWELVASMLRQRSDASAAVLDNKIYIVGGFNGQEVLRSAEVYDPSMNQWSYVSSMTEARSGVSLVSYRGSLYALGGFDGFERLATCERYQPAIGRWQRVASMINPRSNFAAVVMDGKIFVIGGFNGNTTIPDVECYDSDLDRWMDFMPMNLNRSALSACVLAALPNASDYSYMCKILRRAGMPDTAIDC